MGFFDVFKKSRKQVNKENQEQGRAGEKKIKEEYEFSGYKVTRTGKGHDFKAEKKDWFGNKTTKHIEVKTGNSKLSKLQKKKRGRLGDKYVVERLEPTPFGLSSNNRESDLTPKQRKKKSSSIFGSSLTDSFFGSGSSTTKEKTKKKSTTKKKSDNLWGSSSSTTALFGSGSSTTKKKTKKKSTTKKKSDNLWGSSSSTTALFGSGSPKKRKKKSDSIW